MNNHEPGQLLVSALCLMHVASALAEESNERIPGENRPPTNAPVGDETPDADIPLTPFLRLGGRYDTKFELEQNLNLEDDDDEDEVTLEPELTTVLSYEPDERFEAFLATELKREYAFDVSEESETGPLRLDLTEAFLDFDTVIEDGELSLRVGRQRFDDEREWLYDERLDGLRFFYSLDEPFTELSELVFELSVTRQTVFDRQLLTHDDKDKINNYILYARYEAEELDIGDWYELEDVELGAYVFKRDQLSEDDEDPLLMGVQFYAELTEQFMYWMELAHVRGSEGSNEIRGNAVDLTGVYELDMPWKPSLVMGYAFATGDSDPDDGTDRNFRQTGLQDNQHDLGGNVSFRYYGVLLEPELSNLEILTGGVGIKPTDDVSVNLIYHRYRQHAPSDELRDTNLDADPNGESRDVGSAVDLVSGVYFGSWAVDIELGYFMPGNAFDADESDNAFSMEVDLKYRF